MLCSDWSIIFHLHQLHAGQHPLPAGRHFTVRGQAQQHGAVHVHDVLLPGSHMVEHVWSPCHLQGHHLWSNQWPHVSVSSNSMGWTSHMPGSSLSWLWWNTGNSSKLFCLLGKWTNSRWEQCSDWLILKSSLFDNWIATSLKFLFQISYYDDEFWFAVFWLVNSMKYFS